MSRQPNPSFLRSLRVSRRVLLCLFSWALSIVPVVQAASGKQRYGRRVYFALNQEIAFPDFTLRYTGRTHVDSPVFPPGFTYENFVAKDGKHEQIVPWSGGTGIIAPVRFEVGKKSFRLELGYSEQLGALRRNELVILPAPQNQSSYELRTPERP